MSDDAGLAEITPGDARDRANLATPAGERVRPAARRAQTQTDELADFVQQQPLATALIALIIGYLLGKIT